MRLSFKASSKVNRVLRSTRHCLPLTRCTMGRRKSWKLFLLVVLVTAIASYVIPKRGILGGDDVMGDDSAFLRRLQEMKREERREFRVRSGKQNGASHLNINILSEKFRSRTNQRQGHSPVHLLKQSKIRSNLDNDTSAQNMANKQSKQSVRLSLPTLEDAKKIFKYEDAAYEKYNLNVHLSQSLPLNRTIQEIRPPVCTRLRYALKNVKVSIVVPFYNEMWAVLLRSLYTILIRSPPDMLLEVIMVDDSSSFPNLHGPLDTYIQYLPKVRLVRLSKREGLMRARMAGARLARGDVIVFLDAHVECSHGWLEPLVDRVVSDKKIVAVPVVNSVDPDTFDYTYMPIRSQGSFSWELDYVWKDQFLKYENIGVAAHPTATMTGCAFAVDKEMFFHFGGFDEGMDIWGGEQIEISFRTWMCGGSMEIVPCSHVGHIYRAHLPYAFTQGILYRNQQRIAEVWMDDFKRYYYYTIPFKPLVFSPGELSSIRKRKELRHKLNCKPFSWYLKNLAPEVEVPPTGALLYGQMKSVGSSMCLAQYNQTHFSHFREIGVNHCSLHVPSMTFSFTDSSQLVYKGMCFRFRGTEDSTVTLALCDTRDPYQIWQYVPGYPTKYVSLLKGIDVRKPIGSFRLKHGNSSLCLSQMTYSGWNVAGALDCGARNPHQYWIFTHALRYNVRFQDVYANA